MKPPFAGSQLEARLSTLARAFFEKAERERRWSVFEDLPWGAALTAPPHELVHVVETFFVLEASAPSFAGRSLEAMRCSPALTSFVTSWNFDKGKRLIAFREWLVRAAGRSHAELSQLELQALAAPLSLRGLEGLVSASRRLVFFGCLQEMVAFVTYAKHREVARREQDECLRTLYDFLARDDIAHARFLQQALALHLEQDREGTLADMAGVLSDFTLPGRTVLSDWETRMQAIRGPGLDLQTFIQRVYVPVLKHLGVGRHEILRRRTAPPEHDGAADG
jgi:acyl-[acyl-carrier-protein] desaturase